MLLCLLNTVTIAEKRRECPSSRVRSESSMAACLVAKGAKFFHVDNADSDFGCAGALADLSLHWMHISENTLSNLSTPIV